MRILITHFLLGTFFCFSQAYQPKDIDFEGLDLHPPMEIELILAGNFGEMRSNHFHTGLDIKTNRVEGQKIFSVADGYVSRVRVSPWGYGLALYVDHTNGLTSVYGHLQKFTPEIDSLVHRYQVKRESYVVDEIVLQDSFYVSKGQLIAYSGNSGSSSAPHLHFELRETKTEHALNPLLFKCYRDRIEDTTDPGITGIKFYAVNNKGYMIPGKGLYYRCRQAGKSLEINYGKPIDVSKLVCKDSYLAIGAHTTDKLDGAGNICGVHNTTVKVGKKLIHEQKIDYINFEHNRFLNSHQDYFEFDQNRKHIHKQFATAVNPLPIYPQNGGLIEWKDVNGKTIHFKAVDIHGNKSTVDIRLKHNDKTMNENPFLNSEKYLFPDSVNAFLRDGFQILMEKGTFYEPLQRLFKIDSSETYLSPEYQFSEYAIPVQKYFDVRIHVPDLGDDFPYHKLGIGRISDRNYLSFLGGDFVGGWVESSSRNFGTFVIVVDTIAPKIKPLDFRENKDISRYKNVQFELEDDMSGIATYKAYLNGKWVVTEYDRRRRRYIVPFDKWSKPILREGKNKLRIVVKDRKGNRTEKAYTLIR